MSDLDVNKIRESFEIIKPIAANVADKFYELLFTDFPSSRELFKGVDLEMQQKALINSLSYVVDHLEDANKLKKFLNDLGSRHANYGTEELHFEWVGCSLLKTLKFFFAEKWTDDLEKEWVDAFLIISKFMKEGMNPKSDVTETAETNEDSLESQELDKGYEHSEQSSSIEEVSEVEQEEEAEHSDNVVPISENKSVQIPVELQNKIRNLVKTSIDHYIEEEIIKALNEQINVINEEDITVHLKKIVNG